MRDLISVYRRAHNAMRNVDGLQPQEAFDELLKFLFFMQLSEENSGAAATAKTIRQSFAKYVDCHGSWSTSLWRDKDFHLSDNCLEQLYLLFVDIRFSAIDFDIRSAALREFLTPEIRKGLGIYLTPDDVVREVVRYIDPAPSAKCLDPACGSGTFLIELIRHWRQERSQKLTTWGADKNPRMLLMAELNLGHLTAGAFNRQLMDSLTEPAAKHGTNWCRPGYFDFVLTNPPFGVTVDTTSSDYGRYDTAHTETGQSRLRQSSEWLFIEQSLRWLKPGGTLAIVLPKSAFTNPSASMERSALSKLGFLKALVILPPETFLVTGAQTNAVVAFIEKYRSREDRSKPVTVHVANITNVGYDSTGRGRQGSQLSGLAERLKDPSAPSCDFISVISPVIASSSLDVLTTSSVAKRRTGGGIPLGDLVETIKTGRTPPRAAYSEEAGLFLVKVGNLSGSGINWIARERNFIDTTTKVGRRFTNIEMIRTGDILLTSSAHSPVYIAKKVDIVTEVPQWVGGRAAFVGEVMLVRVKPDVLPPTLLLAYLRQPAIAARIQAMVRGQTAHLHPDDVAELSIPESLLESSDYWQSVGTLLQEEAELNDRLNELAHQQQSLFAKFSDNVRAA